MPLSKEFADAVRTVLTEVFPARIAIQPSDVRRVLRPTGPGSHSVSIEPYWGSLSSIAFGRVLDTSESVQQLRTAIEQFQPELFYRLVLPNCAVNLSGCCHAMVAVWCSALKDASRADLELPDAIEDLLICLGDVIDKKRLVHRTITSLAGLTLEAVEEPVVVSEGVTLRLLTGGELITLGAHDITSATNRDLISCAVSCCIELETECNFSLEPLHSEVTVGTETIQDATDKSASIIRALHVLKPGRTGVYLTQTEFTPKLLPFLSGSSSWPINRPQFASLTVVGADIAEFLEIERNLRDSNRQELRIATDRLVDAESRLSPVDALLDAVIGLEVVLNPMDSSELAFRVALNYAYLAPPKDRRNRYEQVRLVQKTRNRVVHGGLNLKSSDASIIHEHAALAKACLRDTLKRFVLDKRLGGTRKLDADFWLDRIIPLVQDREIE